MIGQVLNTLPYQRRQIALSTLTENNVKVKIFKNPSLNMDTLDYDSIFCQFLHVCVTKTPHLDHDLTVSSPFGKALYTRTSIEVEGLPFACTFRKGKNPV